MQDNTFIIHEEMIQDILDLEINQKIELASAIYDFAKGNKIKLTSGLRKYFNPFKKQFILDELKLKLKKEKLSIKWWIMKNFPNEKSDSIIYQLRSYKNVKPETLKKAAEYLKK